jgi:tetratricopeptide (TPR) repeat protein
MIHGGWSRRPFDVAPDRTFDYDGALFLPAAMQPPDTWQARLSSEAERLGQVLKAALDTDAQTIGSPVYKEVVGLKPVDWTGIQTARAKYFGEVFADWKARVEVAKLDGWPGDILTLADDAPTRFHRCQLLWHACDALCSMHRFEAALPVLNDLMTIDPRHREAQTRLGLVLSRLGRVNEAKVCLQRVAQEYENDPEAHGILGRVYKDLWRLEWEELDTIEARQQQAIATSAYIASALRSYDKIARRRFDSYNGINVVSMVKLLEFLAAATNDRPVDINVTDVDSLAAVVRFAASNTLASAGLDSGQEGVWAAATLGELELVLGNANLARTHYRNAANAPAATYFNVNSMLDQIDLFESLGFRPDGVAAVKKVLEQRRDLLEKKIGGLKRSEPKYGKVVLASGHMIDAPDRVEARFPAAKEGAVREAIARQLDAWKIGGDALGLCGGACGTDILFAELCVERGVEVWLMLPLPEPEFLNKSVRRCAAQWEQRYFDLRDHSRVRTVTQPERLKAPPKDVSVFARNNLWIVNTARVEVNDAKRLYALLVWDEGPGDGPGGTADCAARVRQLGGRSAIINPTRL